VDTIAEDTRDFRKIVVRMHPERAGTKRKPVGRRRAHGRYTLKIRKRACDARQAEQGPGGIIRVDCKDGPRFLNRR